MCANKIKIVHFDFTWTLMSDGKIFTCSHFLPIILLCTCVCVCEHTGLVCVGVCAGTQSSVSDFEAGVCVMCMIFECA